MLQLKFFQNISSGMMIIDGDQMMDGDHMMMLIATWSSWSPSSDDDHSQFAMWLISFSNSKRKSGYHLVDESLPLAFANGHTSSNTPDPIRTRKLSGERPGQYWGGGPPGKPLGCCWLFWSIVFFDFLSFQNGCSNMLSTLLIPHAGVQPRTRDMYNENPHFCISAFLHGMRDEWDLWCTRRSPKNAKCLSRELGITPDSGT